MIESDTPLAEWTARHRHEAALTLVLRRHLPRPIAERVRVSAARDGVLELAAGAGAIATALRQRIPQLRAGLAREGLEFADIRVRVQVAATGPGGRAAQPRRWNAADAAPLYALAERLQDGPLKDALARWSRRARGR